MKGKKLRLLEVPLVPFSEPSLVIFSVTSSEPFSVAPFATSSVTSWYPGARTKGGIRLRLGEWVCLLDSRVARFRPRSLGCLAAGLAGSRGRTRFVIWFTTRFMTRFTTLDTYPVRLWRLITRQRYTMGVCQLECAL